MIPVNRALGAVLAISMMSFCFAPPCLLAQPVEVAALRPPNPIELAGYGQSVSVDGDRAAVLATVGEPDKGRVAVWIYILARGLDGQWDLEHHRVATYNALGALAPGGLMLRGDRLFVAILSPDDSVFGAVFVYERDAGGSAQWGEVDVVRALSPSGIDNFANDLDVDGDRMMVAAPNLFAYPIPGTAYLFERDTSGTWEEVAALRPDDSTIADGFGMRVAISGSTVAVSAHAGMPRVYLFEQDSDGWRQVARIPLSDGTSLFTPDVALWNEHFVTTAPHRPGMDDGAWAFRRLANSPRGAGTWIAGPELRPPGGGGHRLALEDGVLVFPGPEGAYVYFASPEVWTYSTQLDPSNVTPGPDFHMGLDSDGIATIVGTPWDNLLQPSGGAAFLFEGTPFLFADGFESGDARAWTEIVP